MSLNIKKLKISVADLVISFGLSFSLMLLLPFLKETTPHLLISYLDFGFRMPGFMMIGFIMTPFALINNGAIINSTIDYALAIGLVESAFFWGAVFVGFILLFKNLKKKKN